MSVSLEDVLNNPELNNKLLTQSQTLGFVTAMATAPYLINPTEWLAYLWGGDETSPFESHQAFEDYANAIVDIWNDTRQSLFENTWQWPSFCQLDEQEIVTPETREFTEGLLQGWQITQDDWQNLMPEDSQDNALLGGLLLSISLLYDPETGLETLSEHGADGLAQFTEIFQAVPAMLCGITQRGQILAAE